jgi:hypothetical protein
LKVIFTQQNKDMPFRRREKEGPIGETGPASSERNYMVNFWALGVKKEGKVSNEYE